MASGRNGVDTRPGRRVRGPADAAMTGRCSMRIDEAACGTPDAPRATVSAAGALGGDRAGRPNVSYGDRAVALAGEVLRGVVGSTVHGLAIGGQDDLDLMGVTIPPAEYVCGLAEFDQHVWRTQPEGVRSGPGDVDLTVFGLRKWMRLATAGNPTIIALLFVPEASLHVRTEEGERLRALAPSIVSRRAGDRFLGYLLSQRERMDGRGRQARVPNRPELVEKYGYDTKYAGHALRLGLQGVELMTTGRLELPMAEPDRTHVLEVRRGDVDRAEAVRRIDAVTQRLVDELASSRPNRLRDQPDLDAVNAYLVDAHRRAWS